MTAAKHPPAEFYDRLLSHVPGKVALLFSGGKDATCLLHIFRDFLDGIIVMHGDTNDLLPDVRELVEAVSKTVPHFARVESDAPAWIVANATPSDLVPFANTPVGRMSKGGRRNIITLAECCAANRWKPWGDWISRNGITLMLHGQRRSDVRSSFSEAYEGATPSGVERWAPLADWSDDDALDYIKANNLPLSKYYGYKPNMPECATCPASWYEGRAAYLRRHHPELAARYRKHLLAHAADIKPALADLNKELSDIGP